MAKSKADNFNTLLQAGEWMFRKEPQFETHVTDRKLGSISI